ncbi:filament integrity protein FraC [Laspinema sp. D2d]|uniref:filament integrity protein FraC n=1 Tax=Laspinema sp. D2d TaxID=2953686 RepID=UPI003982F8F1
MVFPLPTILLQTFFLTISVAIESSVFYSRCPVSRKTSVEYALAINLISACVGWFFFFYIEPFLSPPLKIQLITYVFLNQLGEGGLSLVFLIGFIVFWANFAIKLISLNLFNKVIDPTYPLKPEYEADLENDSRYSTRKIKKAPERRQAMAVLWGHCYSHSVILFVLWIKDIENLN